MSKLIILNKVPDKTQENDCHNTHCDNDCLDVQIHKILHTNCNCCIKEFIDNLKCYELFKFYWKPILFRRNTGKFEYKSNNYDLLLNVNIDEGRKEKKCVSQFNIKASLNILYKKNHHISKNIDLINIWCNYDEKNKILKYREELYSYFSDVFGIDLADWDNIHN